MRFLAPSTIYLIFLAMFALSSVSGSHAASSQWQDLGGGKARLVALLDPVSNRVRGAIEVQLKPGWSTYWRYPGSSGIPPKFDFSSSRNLGEVKVQFPAPSKLGEMPRSYAGYKGSVLFPFTAFTEAGNAPDMKLNLLIGVCEEICIPAVADFKISASELSLSDPEALRIVSFADLQVPKTISANDVGLKVKMTEGETLKIELKNPGGFEKSDLFVEGPMEWSLLPAKKVAGSDGRLVFELDVSRVPADATPAAAPLHFTLSTGRSGLEFSR